jgi:hypothetical protein
MRTEFLPPLSPMVAMSYCCLSKSEAVTISCVINLLPLARSITLRSGQNAP